MIINVHAGHTKQSGKSCGAGSPRTNCYESVENRKIKNELIKILKSNGHTVYDCTAEGNSMRDNLKKIVEKCNKHKADLDLSIHLNCYNGNAKGTECWCYSQSSKSVKFARKITMQMEKLGFVNRGVKFNSGFYVLYHTIAPAIIIETFFCDSVSDVNLYKKLTYKKIAKAIADAIEKVKK